MMRLFWHYFWARWHAYQAQMNRRAALANECDRNRHWSIVLLLQPQIAERCVASPPHKQTKEPR